MTDPTPPVQASQQQTFRIGEEFGTPKKNLPPLKVIVAGIAIILLAWGIAAFIQRPQALASGSLDEVNSAEIPNQHAVMVAMNVSVHNNGTKPFWIKTITADLQTADQSYSADAASAVDFDRYYQAFPVLKPSALAPLQREAKISSGEQTRGTILVSFPVTPEVFAARKSLRVTIQPYDQPVPLVLTK